MAVGYAFAPQVDPRFTSTEQSAWAQLQTTLGQYGFVGADLTALVNWTKAELIAGKGTDQISLVNEVVVERRTGHARLLKQTFDAQFGVGAVLKSLLDGIEQAAL